MRRVDVNLAAPEGADLGEGEPLWLVGYYEGVPIAQVELPWPGQGADLQSLVGMTLGRAAAPAIAQRELADELERRLGFGPRPAPPPCRVSVVLCTARRGPLLDNALDALGRLDPRPDELIVVESGGEPGGHRTKAEAAGARYLHEPLVGLDRARTAGLAAAAGEVVVFTDDDCVPPPRWLSMLPQAFADRAVAAVAGPVFPLRLGNPVQRCFERVASMRRGLTRRVVDWRDVPPGFGYSIGVGANLAFRRRTMLALGEPFPPELDAGTATESGGDAYALYRVLAAGHRVVYEPGFYTFHQHRVDADALRRAIVGYGTGIAAAATRMALVDRDAQALHAVGWLVRQYGERQTARLSGGGDAADVRAAAWYIAGALRGPWRWGQARIGLRRGARRTLPSPPPPVPQPPARRYAQPQARSPAISVVVPTTRPRALRSCLAALGVGADGVAAELIVVHDAPGDVPGDIAEACALPVRSLRTGGAGAGAARNAGARAATAPLVLFVDDDVIAPPGLVAGHVRAHEGARRPRAVVGPYLPEPRLRNWASALVALWWEDHFRRLQDGVPTFVDVTSGNLSVPRDPFLELGGFDASFGSRREDWELGLRILEEGWEVRPESSLAATHRYELRTAGLLRSGFMEGRGDARIAGRRPAVASALQPATWIPKHERRLARHPGMLAARAAVRVDSDLRGTARALDLLERTGSSRWWLSACWFFLGAAYRRGLASGGGIAPGASIGARIDVRLDGDSPAPARPVPAAPSIRAVEGGEAGAATPPPDGQWHREIAEAAAEEAPLAAWRARIGKWPPPPPAEAPARVALSGGGRSNWREADVAIRHTRASAVLVSLPGTAPPDAWDAEAAALLAGERVGGVAIAAADGPRYASTPLAWSGADGMHPLLPPWLDRVRALGVRRDAYLAVGGLDASLAAIHPDAPWVDLLERLVGAGRLVATTRLLDAPAGGGTAQPSLAHAAALGARSRAGDADAAVRLARLVGVAALSAAPRVRRGGRRAGARQFAAVMAGAVRGLSHAPSAP